MNTTRDPQGLPFGAITVVGLAGFLRLLSSYVRPPSTAIAAVWELLPYILATIVGGLVALHVFEVSWKGLTRLVIPLFSLVALYLTLSLTGGASVLDRTKYFLVYVVGTTGGLFLLPLIAPRARRGIPPGIFRRLTFALILTLGLVVIGDFLLSRSTPNQFGLVTLALGNFVGALAIGVGIIAIAFHYIGLSVWAGGVGATLCVISFMLWIALGTPWFP